ncbi:MAG: protein-export membrane protein SecD [Coxiella sp. RIFCSPHIGHO2_12_FULL_44_14]|nr:MAG: protein-export membrane protein SecD [Coxiella sp. RIFCSPHIGHO2_12_FULL_44_14]
MNQYPLWRYVLLITLIVFAVIYALPNLYGEDPSVQISPKESTTLDATLIGQLETALKQQQIPYLSMKQSPGFVTVRFSDTEAQLKAQDIIQATLGNKYSVALNLASRTPKWLLAIGARPMKLGLDLRGGIHFLLDVDTDALVQLQESGDIHTMGVDLRNAQIRYQSITQPDKTHVTIEFRNLQDRDQAQILLQKNFPNYLFITNNLALSATFSPSALTQIQQNAIEQITTILRTRINELGVAEPVVQQQGVNHISVDLPGIQDMARAKDIIGKVATIRLQLQDVEHNAETAAQTGVIPAGTKLYFYQGQPILLKNQVILHGTSIINAVSTIGDDGRPTVQVRVSGSEASAFNQITAANVGRSIAAVYIETQTTKKLENGKVVTTHIPVEKVINLAIINSALGNNFQITGLESMAYAKELALLLRSGAYPVPVDFIQERVVGPSLGKENIHMGVLSTEIGSLLVIAFMVVYYRFFGLIADLALILNILFIIAILSLLGATLTLPGIAGIVLTVGIAVDANVLVNERIREELRNAMSPQASIHAGYGRAFATIVDANVTTLIVAMVLFAVGSGLVQGFAVTLTIGILCSMVTAIFFTRAVVNLIYGRRKIKQLPIGITVKST